MSRTAQQPSERSRNRTSIEAVWVQAGVVLATWSLLLLAENLVVAIAFRTEFAGSWETRATRRVVLPIALGALVPASFVAVAIGHLAERRRAGFAVVAATAGTLTAWGVSNGRHLASLAARVPFVAGVGAIAAALAWWSGPALARAARSNPRPMAVFGGAACAAFWFADERILPRLYPAFHLALFAMMLGSAALVALALRPSPGDPTRAPAVVALVALALGALAMIWTPAAARLLASADNLRIILVEHAPLEGRAVWLASLLAPPPSDDPVDPSRALPSASGELPRVLDWTGRDIVLLTVDALRADHLSSYGYARATTPNLDALARSGARFDAAYCPTPHTSYSVASLMTGKYMRPLVALGLGADSDTWAAMLRRYGYRTAAFYPPAVFFIDGDRFQAMRDRGLDFEYRKEEFADPALRAKQVGEYLASVSRDKPLFLWVHFFEPHEPYVAHAEHTFGEGDVDRYDSEIAAADDGIGRILEEVRASRPGAVVIATADHGEEFGEHGGRYHGTTVYEEQVRVPLLIDGPGVRPEVVGSVVQTIDLLPTVLSALGIPRPARLRGRDIGPLFVAPAVATRDGGSAPPADPGLAFAETDEYTLLARGGSRLVCTRRAAACALYDRSRDPGETHDVATERPEEARELRRSLTAIASEHGRFEHGEEAAWPEALRRGIAGDADAATEVAALLDDANVRIRTKAAEVSFDLHAAVAVPAMRRALGKGASGSDEPLRRWCALALVRMGEVPTAAAESLLEDRDVAWRRVSALAFAERGDARGAAELAGWWSDRDGVEYVRATEILAAIEKIRDRAAVQALIRSLDDVRLRPLVAETLAAIGDPTARAPLAVALGSEAQVTSRAREARSLERLGGASWLGPPRSHLETKLDVPAVAGGKRLRLVVLSPGESPCEVSVGGARIGAPSDSLAAPTFELDAGAARSIVVTVDDRAGVEALFLLSVPVAPPRDGGAEVPP